MNDETTVPDLYRLAFMPGCFRCPKCNFHLTKSCCNTTTGEIGTREEERESEPCPNDGTMMVHVTYKEQLAVYADRLKEEFERFEARVWAESAFVSELYVIMIGPLPEGGINVADAMVALKQAATGKAKETACEK
jgi:hypothetical protein